MCGGAGFWCLLKAQDMWLHKINHVWCSMNNRFSRSECGMPAEVDSVPSAPVSVCDIASFIPQFRFRI